jgi:hypothetical protein
MWLPASSNLWPMMSEAAADWWEPARQRALAKLSTDLLSLIAKYGPDDATERYVSLLQDIKSPGWIPARPPRKMPSLWQIAQYWDTRDVFYVDLEAPHCFACPRPIQFRADHSPKDRWNSAAHQLLRGHLVNRKRDGLDGPQNIVPICNFCHRFMGMYSVEDGAAAIEWVLDGGPWPELIERYERREKAQAAE